MRRVARVLSFGLVGWLVHYSGLMKKGGNVARIEILDAAQLLATYTHRWACWFVLMIAMVGSLSADDSNHPTLSTTDSATDHAVTLDNPQLTESSGLAFSRRNVDRVWTHNDSGDQPILYCFDLGGRSTGRVELPVQPVDWEDMAAFSDHGIPRLLVADCGDNGKARKSISLHLIDEPDPDAVTKATFVQSIIVTFPNGPSDCEAIAVDAGQRTIVMIAKSLLSSAIVLTVPLPPRITEPDSLGDSIDPIAATELKTLAMPLVTGMDLDSATGDLLVTSYFRAFRFRSDGTTKSLTALLDQSPERIRVPPWKQIEAIAVDSNGRVWVTTEGRPARFGRLSLPQNIEPNTRSQK